MTGLRSWSRPPRHHPAEVRSWEGSAWSFGIIGLFFLYGGLRLAQLQRLGPAQPVGVDLALGGLLKDRRQGDGLGRRRPEDQRAVVAEDDGVGALVLLDAGDDGVDPFRRAATAPRDHRHLGGLPEPHGLVVAR